MQSWRTGIGLIGALLPVAYCVGLVWYFADMGGWNDPLFSQELKPTIIGLAVVGLIFAVVLGFRLRRAFRSPGNGGGTGLPPARSSETWDDQPDDRPDADAMIARYLAERDASAPAQAGPAAVAAATRLVVFGRRPRT